MKKYIFLIIFLLGCLELFSQNQTENILVKSDSLNEIGFYDTAEELLLKHLQNTHFKEDSFLILAKLCCLSKSNNLMNKTQKYGYQTIADNFNEYIHLEAFGDVLYNLAVAKFRFGEIDSTFYYAEKSLEIRRKYLKPTHKNIVQNLIALGIFHSNTGNTNLSIQYQEQALAVAIKIKPLNYNSLVSSYFSLGSAYHSSNNLFKAKLNYDKALSFYKNNLATNTNHKGHIYNALGIILESQKDYEVSQEYYKEAIQIFTNTNDLFTTSIAYSNLANNYTNLGKYGDAKKIHKSIITLFEGTEFENELPWKYLNLGATYMECLQYDSALVVLEKARILNDKVSKASNELSTVILNHFASIYMEIDENKKAENSLHKSIDIALTIFGKKDPDLAESYYLLAKNYFLQDQFQSSIKYLKSAEEALILSNSQILDFTEEIISRTLLLDIYILKEKNIWNQYKLNNNINHLTNLYQTTIITSKLSNVILDLYDHENAKLNIFKAIDENIYYGVKASKELYDLTQDDKYTEQALRFFESEKSTLLKQEYSDLTAKKSTQIVDTLLIREDQLKRDISHHQNLFFAENDPTSEYSKTISSTIFHLKRELDELLQELELNNPNYYAKKYQKLDINILNVQENLSLNETLIEYYEYENEVFSISFTKARIKFEHILIDQLETKILSFNKSILNSDINTFSSLAFEFYSTLIEKNLSKLTNNQLTIIPSKSISLLSFDTFITKIPKNISYNNLNYLIKRKAISYKNSLQPLYQKSIHAQKDYLGVKPTFKDTEFRNLYGASKEIETIAKNFGGEVLKDDSNLKQSIIEKLADYKIIHFATHAVLNTTNASYSSLLLGDNLLNADDNLYAHEIQSSKLNADLVVLSACNTGVGEIKTGEGLASLARSFNYAGAKSVLVGLWALPDLSTSSIVNDFFSDLKHHNKSVALKNAKTTYLNTADEHLANPIFWAGLIVIGENNAICLDQTNSKSHLILLILVVSVLFLFRKKLF